MHKDKGAYSGTGSQDNEKLIYIYEVYKKKLLVIAMRYLHNQYDAEDAVALTYEKLARNMSLVGDPDSVQTKALLSVITKNNALNMLRERKRADYLEDVPDNLSCASSENIERGFEEKEGYETIIKAINNMSDTYKDALILKHVNGYNISEISKILGIEYHAAAKRIERGEKMLRSKLMKRGAGNEE